MTILHTINENILALDHPVFGHIPVDPDHHTIRIDDEDLVAELLAIHQNGKPIWETGTQFDERRTQIELERKRDPAQQAILLEKLVELQAKQAGIDLDTPASVSEAPAEADLPPVVRPEVDDSEAVRAAGEAKDYEILSKSDLAVLAASRGIDPHGVKATLIERLRNQDAGQR